MGRTTQVIGLNNYARLWIKSAIKVETYQMTEGMFNEPVGGRIFHLPPKGLNKALIAKEVVQVVPWSSGPMIFTHLQVTLVRKGGEQVVDMGFHYSWMVDPMLETEYDSETGRYYV